MEKSSTAIVADIVHRKLVMRRRDRDWLTRTATIAVDEKRSAGRRGWLGTAEGKRNCANHRVHGGLAGSAPWPEVFREKRITIDI